MSFARLAVAAIALSVLAAACSSSDTPDTGINYCAPPLNYTGNAKNVGAGCTQGGNQCAANGEGKAQFCAIDVDPEGAPFCILIGCSNHEACGAGACCTGREGQAIHACVPKPCLVDNAETDPCPEIPGLNPADSGTGTNDASTADAGAAD